MVGGSKVEALHVIYNDELLNVNYQLIPHSPIKGIKMAGNSKFTPQIKWVGDFKSQGSQLTLSMLKFTIHVSIWRYLVMGGACT